MYGVYSLGGFALLSIATATFVVAAFSIAAAAARQLGAGARAIWVMFLPVLVAAPWAWSIRAQMLALPLYTGLLWLLATEARQADAAHLARAPAARRLGERARQRGARRAARDAARASTSWSAAAARPGRAISRCSSSPRSPSSPRRTAPSTTARYYHLLLVDPPFAGRVTEWRWAAPAVEHDRSSTRSRRSPSSSSGSAAGASTVLRHRRPRAHVRRRRERDPRDRLVRARVHGLRPGRDRPQAREQEAAASRAGG